MHSCTLYFDSRFASFPVGATADCETGAVAAGKRRRSTRTQLGGLRGVPCKHVNVHVNVYTCRGGAVALVGLAVGAAKFDASRASRSCHSPAPRHSPYRELNPQGRVTAIRPVARRTGSCTAVVHDESEPVSAQRAHTQSASIRHGTLAPGDAKRLATAALQQDPSG